MAAADTAAKAAANATPTPAATEPSAENLPFASSLCSPDSSTSSPSLSAFLAESCISSPIESMASAFSLAWRSMRLSSAWASLSLACHAFVRESFSPKDLAALSRASRITWMRPFCASMDLFRTSFLAASAAADLSFLSNCESTSFISEPRTLKVWSISRSCCLNCFSPSRPIFNPNVSAICLALLS